MRFCLVSANSPVEEPKHRLKRVLNIICANRAGSQAHSEPAHGAIGVRKNIAIGFVDEELVKESSAKLERMRVLFDSLDLSRFSGKSMGRGYSLQNQGRCAAWSVLLFVIDETSSLLLLEIDRPIADFEGEALPLLLATNARPLARGLAEPRNKSPA